MSPTPGAAADRNGHHLTVPAKQGPVRSHRIDVDDATWRKLCELSRITRRKRTEIVAYLVARAEAEE